MSFVATPSQQEAIDTIDQSLAVTAGAGSGKTRVLVERYLNLLNRGIRLEEIAAITFTKKAAQEMKDRLGSTYPQLIERLEQAQISTVHSLCQRIIQEHPLEAGIDPRFRLGEEWETAALLYQIIEEETDVSEAPEALGSQSERIELIQSIYNQMLARGDLRFWQPLPPAPDYTADLVLLCRQVEQFLSLEPLTDVQRQAMQNWSGEWEALKVSLFSDSDEFVLETLEIIRGYLTKIRGRLAEQTEEIVMGIKQVTDAIQEKRGTEIVAWCGKVLELVHRAYRQRKMAQGILDYNDLEHLARRLLKLPQVRANYPFQHLMVDEFQDTNPLQKEIVDLIVKGGASLFVVGDPKQSIYRFRGADVNVFLTTMEEMEEEGKNVFLEENFRSRPEIIDFVNHFFSELMKEDPVGYQALQAKREPLEAPGVNIIATPVPDEISLADARPFEARQVAWKIKELVEEGTYKYEDISVLFRVGTNIRLYEQALQAEGIPYVNLGGRGFYSRQEIQDVLSYFNWLEDAQNEVARLAVLRSPFYLISDDGLYWVARNQEQHLSAREKDALQRAVRDYAFLRELMQQKSAPEVITAMLERTDYIEKTRRLLFGEQKAANVQKLLEQSWDLYLRDVVSVAEQVRYIRSAARDGDKEGEAMLDAEHADVVILRTIHGAKGLEFPVVFLPDTNGRLTRHRGEKVLYHPDFGLTYKGLAGYEALREQNRQEELCEARRLLYVALTRAQEEVFWCGLERDSDQYSWWSWLEKTLPRLPSGLYRLVPAKPEPGQETAPAAVEKQIEPEMHSISSRRQALPPQYGQVSFSVTALMDYARCPRHYYFRYILGVPEDVFGWEGEAALPQSSDSLNALQRGNIVHRVCEQISVPDQLSSLLDYAASMEGVQLKAAERAQLEKTIAPYLQSEFFQRVQRTDEKWRIYREKDFALPFDNGRFILNGLVDQVFVGKENIEVVDFKSNRVRKEEVPQEGATYQVQLRLYAWAMEKEFGFPVTRSLAYFLLPNEVFSLAPELLVSAQTEQWLIALCRQLIAGTEEGLPAFPAGLDCLNCRYRRYCGKSAEFGENTGVIPGLG